MAVVSLRSPVWLGRATAVLLGAVVGARVFSVWVGSVRYGAYGDLADGIGDVEAAVDADRLQDLAAVVQAPPLMAAIVVYLCWFWRVRVNAEVFEPGGHAKTRGWTVGGWFVPVLNLWFPRRVMVDVWRASAPLGRTVPHGLVDAWWAAWVLSIYSSWAMGVKYRRAETAAELREFAGVTMVTDAVGVVAGVLAILVVLRVTRMQNEKAMAGPRGVVLSVG
ncbi:DUF4328 domain-containing protein [Streptomyces niveiscabiei]|uniref:DUF4328 domain-containing protein n=1 Tax=Streptomyces niveiscabiei TaxID=164115 RepID=UPI0029BE7914|nr:DUF4328 domain-containing protein [Streptomyces niveiscabiei]MDX3384503.1 DUF4328 domain-containing protein [Streptomyces niveiscabiei]